MNKEMSASDWCFKYMSLESKYDRLKFTAVGLFLLGLIGGGFLGNWGAEAHALFKEHCEQAGGAIQRDGKCAKVTVEPITPK